MSAEPVQSEILCFVRERCNVMTFDHLVKLCADFYHVDEIVAARLQRYLPDRLPSRSGTDKHRSILEDIVKGCLNPSITLPTFYAVNISRLSPVDANHCDMAAVLAELQQLRAEVRQLRSLQSDVDSVKQQVEVLTSHIRGSQMSHQLPQML